MRQWTLPVVVAFCVLLSPASTRAQGTPVFVFVPSVDATTNGNGNNQFPFNPESVGTRTIRYQQVYSAAEFAPGVYVITQIAFRAEPWDTPFTGTTGTLQIDFSTTSAAPDALSTTFANNLGADNTTVFSGHWALSTANDGSFDLVLNLDQPFTYNPANGNLLMDVRNFGGGTIDVLNNFFVAFDAQIGVGDSVSRVYTAQSFDGVALDQGVQDPVASLGLVTRFTANYTPSQTPQQQIQSLVATVNALVTGGFLKTGQANGLIQPLQNALTSLAKNKLASACSQLADFQSGVNQLVSSGVLSPQQGGTLFNAAALIRGALGC